MLNDIYDRLKVLKWDLTDYEISKFVPICGDCNDLKLMVNIPKIMPTIPVGKPKVTTETLQDSIFINDPKCKPSIAKTINLQNYITVPRRANREFRGAKFHRNDIIMIEIDNKNLDDMYISTKVDNSRQIPCNPRDHYDSE